MFLDVTHSSKHICRLAGMFCRAWLWRVCLCAEGVCRASSVTAFTLVIYFLKKLHQEGIFCFLYVFTPLLWPERFCSCVSFCPVLWTAKPVFSGSLSVRASWVALSAFSLGADALNLWPVTLPGWFQWPCGVGTFLWIPELCWLPCHQSSACLRMSPVSLGDL